MVLAKLREFYQKSYYPKKGAIIALVTFLILFSIYLILFGIDTFWVNLTGNYTPYGFQNFILYFEAIVPGLRLINFIAFAASWSEGLVGGIIGYIIGAGIILIVYVAIGTILGLIYENPKKKITAISRIVLLILVLYAPAILLPIILNAPYKEYTLEDCNTVEEEEKDECFSIVATDTNNYRICKKIDRQSKRDRCFGSVASYTDNPQICEKIESLLKRDNCFYDTAYGSNDLTICRSITDDCKKGLLPYGSMERRMFRNKMDLRHCPFLILDASGAKS